jgi:hypothetical protein
VEDYAATAAQRSIGGYVKGSYTIEYYTTTTSSGDLSVYMTITETSGQGRTLFIVEEVSASTAEQLPEKTLLSAIIPGAVETGFEKLFDTPDDSS